MSHHHHHDDDHDDFRGLHRDLRATSGATDRRRLLRMAATWGAGFGALNLLGCGSVTNVGETTGVGTGTGTGTGTSTGTVAGGTTAGSCSRIPEETAGPYPGDGSNGANVLNQTGA